MSDASAAAALEAYLHETQGLDQEGVRARLQRALSEGEVNPETAFAFGLAYYHLGDLTSAEACLRLSPREEAHHWLGFTLFDRGLYAQADSEFAWALEGLELDAWCRAKILELRCCCKVRTTPADVSIDDFRKLKDVRDQLSDNDRPVPRELADCLSGMAGCLSPEVLGFAAQAFDQEFREWGLTVASDPRPSVDDSSSGRKLPIDEG